MKIEVTFPVSPEEMVMANEDRIFKSRLARMRRREVKRDEQAVG